jgi:hypothetical protein
VLATVYRPALGPTYPSVQWVPGVLSPGIKRPGSEGDQSPSSNAEVKRAWSYTSTSAIRFHGIMFRYAMVTYVFMVCYLVKNRANFTFTLSI